MKGFEWWNESLITKQILRMKFCKEGEIVAPQPQSLSQFVI